MVSFLLSIEVNNIYLFTKSKKREFRAVIKHLYLKNLTLKEVKAVFANVYNSVNEFKRGCTTKDEYRSRRPVEVVLPK